jgi:hypothetical protein
MHCLAYASGYYAAAIDSWFHQTVPLREIQTNRQITPGRGGARNQTEGDRLRGDGVAIQLRLPDVIWTNLSVSHPPMGGYIDSGDYHRFLWIWCKRLGGLLGFFRAFCTAALGSRVLCGSSRTIRLSFPCRAIASCRSRHSAETPAMTWRHRLDNYRHRNS